LVDFFATRFLVAFLAATLPPRVGCHF
jgi:hypothetical protein